MLSPKYAADEDIPAQELEAILTLLTRSSPLSLSLTAEEHFSMRVRVMKLLAYRLSIVDSETFG